MSHLVLATCVLLAGYASGFNLDVEHAKVFTDPENQAGSYFGFTVSLLKETSPNDGSWLLIGAPRGNSTYPNHRDIIEPGVVYQCRLGENNERCKSLVLDSEGNALIPAPNAGTFQHKKDHAWIGGSMDVQGGESGSIVICGPRWKNQFRDYYSMNGICYWLNGSRDFDNDATQLIPLIAVGSLSYKNHLRDKMATPSGNFTFYFMYGGAGLSVNFVGNSSEIIIGAPGVLDWIGTIIKSKGEVTHSISESDFFIPDPEKRGNVVPDVYFGYSVGSGHFFDSNRMYYVAGAPRDGNLKGKVFIFYLDGELANVRVVLEGHQMGEYFGSSVCVVDLNSDGLDDLVVGAPQYSLHTLSTFQNTGDEGKIYVFTNFGNGRLVEVEDQKNIMGSEQQGARFGTAISNIGDLNNDGFPDIAVGAPYDTYGHGAVYIYQGSNKGINPKFVQRIAAIKIDHSMMGFGISISKGVDVDGNHFNDVAVGAYESGQVVLLKSNPVIYFHANLATDVRRINFTATIFKGRACIYYTGKYSPQSINSTITLTADETYGRAMLIFDSQKTKFYSINATLHYEVNHCQEFQVQILTESHDFSKPIEIKMEYILQDQQGDFSVPGDERKNHANKEFCKTCAVVDPLDQSYIIHKVPYVTGCEDDRCRTDMKTEGSLLDISSPFVIGSIGTMKMKVVVRNAGDPAFLSQTNVSLPSVAPLIRVPKNCKELLIRDIFPENKLLQCDMGNPLPHNDEKQLILEFDVKNIPPGTDQISFNISSGSAGEEVKEEDNIMEITLPLKTVLDLSITGKSSPDQFYLIKKNESYPDRVLSCSHVFEVQNYGPSPVTEAKLTFSIPSKIKTPLGSFPFVEIFQPLATIDSNSLLCNPIGFKYKENNNMSIKNLNDTESDMTTITTTVDEGRDEMGKGEHMDAESAHLGIISSLKLTESGTYFLNCSTHGVECAVIECVAGPFKSLQTRSVITLPLKINPKPLETILQERDTVVISSFGYVDILDLPKPIQPDDHRPDFAEVGTTFFGKLPESKISPWFIVLAVIGGLLILALLIWALVKMGFFKRNKKEELKTLKNKNEMEEALADNMVS